MPEVKGRREAVPAQREFTAEEALEIESDRWRRVAAAFLLGMEARTEQRVPEPWGGLVGGLCLAAAVALVVGVISLASASLGHGP